jgi:hypothetical protein
MRRPAVKLTLTSTIEIAALDGQPRHVHNAGAWFSDSDGVVAHRMEFALWRLLGEPKEIELDFGVSASEVRVAQRAMMTDQPVKARSGPVVGTMKMPTLRPVNPDQ